MRFEGNLALQCLRHTLLGPADVQCGRFEVYLLPAQVHQLGRS
jgi:hypothetical protein